jgi:serine/threonine-protein kinase
VPPALDQVVARATAKEPAERFRDAGQMADALAHALTAPVTAPLPASGSAAPTADTSAQSTAGRRRVLGWLAGVAVLAAVSVALVMATRSDDAPADGSSTTPERAASARDNRSAPPSHPEPKPGDRSPQHNPTSGTNASGPVLPAGLIGEDGKTVEEQLTARGYKVAKADVSSSMPKESVVASLPRPGQPLAPGETVVLLVSNGKPADEGRSYRVPADVVGADAHDVEERLKAQQVHVKKVPVDSAAQKDTVLGSYPAPGSTAGGSELVLLVSSGHAPK